MQDTANESSAYISQWMDQCSREHRRCPKPTASPLPTRIMDLGPATRREDGDDDGDDDSVHVRETADGEVAKYAALSYCWGGPQPMLLTRDNYTQMTSPGGIALGMLPRTIRDAVRTTRSQGLRYLWVDALCIVQDCDQDMSRELSRMSFVFKNACITFSAASAVSCHDGFLHPRRPRPSKVPRFELPFQAEGDGGGGGELGTVVMSEGIYYYSYDDPVNQRAWCFQESFLSPRVVIFGTHELLWQCGDWGDTLFAGGAGRSYFDGMARLPRAYFDDSEGIYAMSTRDLDWTWYDIIIAYSIRSLTYEDDRLVALGALATEHQRLNGGDTYVAGLWRRDLQAWLGWIIDPSPEADRRYGVQPLQPRPRGTIYEDGYIAPSWSWASTRGLVSIAHEKNFRGEILGCEVELRDEALPTGAVKGARLDLRVGMRRARWSGRTLLNGTGPDAEPVGNAWMDADEEKPEVVVCLNMWSTSGIMVVRKEGAVGSTTYTRVGYFEIRGLEKTSWFEGCELETITLV